MDSNELFDNPPLRIKSCRHGTMMYYANDAYIGRSLDLYGEFSEGEAELFKQLVRPGMVVLDVGANIGAHTIVFAQAVGLGGRVYAFEPQRAIHHLLCGNLALNHHTTVVAYHAAVGRGPGSVRVPRIDYTKDSNFGGLALGTWTQGDVVSVLTLDSLNLDRCHFIKIDVEGMELDVLAGARKLLALHQPLLYVENDRTEKSAALIEWLLTHGFHLYWHLPPLFNPSNYYSHIENVFGGTISINMLCVPATNPLKVDGLREIKAPGDTWQT